jgi:hypothetical protein
VHFHVSRGEEREPAERRRDHLAVASCQKPENHDTVPPKDAQGKVVKFPGAGAASTKEYKAEFAAPCKAGSRTRQAWTGAKGQAAGQSKQIGDVSKRLNKKD